MSANAMRHSRTAWWSWLISGLTLLASGGSVLWAGDSPHKGLPADVERFLKWLPEDTETLVVARSFPMNDSDLFRMSRWSELGPYAMTESCQASQPFLSSIVGRRVGLAVRGARGFDVVTSFGGLRGEGCSIFTWERPLKDGGRELIAAMRRRADAVRSIEGRDVFVFPSMISEEPWIRQKPWEGAFFVLLDSTTLLHATSDRYLAELLRRVDHPARARALPVDLAEWRHIDYAAPSWILRHYPREDSTTHAVGMVAQGESENLRVVYVPRPGTKVDSKQVESQWTAGLWVTREQGAKFRFDVRDDGSVRFTATGAPDFTNGMGMWVFQLQMLPAMDVGWAEAPKKP